MTEYIEKLDELITFLETLSPEEYDMLPLEQQFELHTLRLL